jgi:DNA modification methylase
MINWRILTGDVRDMLAQLEPGSVQTCVTSPPYWGLRDYGVAGQLGLESTPDAYCAAMVSVFREVRRVLRDDGTVWLNLGDSYASNSCIGRKDQDRPNGADIKAGKARSGRADVGVAFSRTVKRIPEGLKDKDLVGIPWMVAFALRADGWYLRSDIIWSKPNPMPESVTDRPTKAHEYIFLLSKSRSYFYDEAAIREPANPDTQRATRAPNVTEAAGNMGGNKRTDFEKARHIVFDRNKRSVWAVATQPYPDAHFATYPEKLIEPCILAGSKEGDTVLDPFTGSGTTGAVSVRLQRNFVGCELNPAYVQLARKRIGDVAPLLATEVA